MVKNISAEEAQNLISNIRDLLIIDVRTTPEIERGKIKGSVNIPLDVISKKLDKISKDKSVLVYCLSGSRSAVAAEMLDKQGYTKVYNLSNGLLGWRMKEYSLV